jgi:hypothetical protein
MGDICGGMRRKSESHRRHTSLRRVGPPEVVLQGVRVGRCDKCGQEEVATPNITGLHRRIAAMLGTRKSALAAAEFRF